MFKQKTKLTNTWIRPWFCIHIIVSHISSALKTFSLSETHTKHVSSPTTTAQWRKNFPSFFFKIFPQVMSQCRLLLHTAYICKCLTYSDSFSPTKSTSFTPFYTLLGHQLIAQFIWLKIASNNPNFWEMKGEKHFYWIDE